MRACVLGGCCFSVVDVLGGVLVLFVRLWWVFLLLFVYDGFGV